MSKLTALIVAGGSGSRMQADRPKQFLDLAGKPILIHTLNRFLTFDDQLLIQLVLPEDSLEYWKKTAAEFLDPANLRRIDHCTGGASRSDSVQNGLEALNARIDPDEEALVAIHDGVRPFIEKDMIREAYDKAQQFGASVACVPVKSSLRKSNEGGGSDAVDRSQYFHVQTPQTFFLSKILPAYRNRPTGTFTDDASLFQAAGGKVVICSGSYENIKITTPEDLFVAEGILQRHL